MLRALVVLGVAFAGSLPASAARGDHAPAIVVPTRPGIPVVINYRDASWCVVEGDWGLYRPGHMAPTVICPAPWIKYHHHHRSHSHGKRAIVSKDPWYRPGHGYYPAYGSRPERGRVEIEPSPDRSMPEPAESYSRSWSTHSEPRHYESQPDPRKGPQPYADQYPNEVPATITDPNAFNPPIVVVPQIHRRRP